MSADTSLPERVRNLIARVGIRRAVAARLDEIEADAAPPAEQKLVRVLVTRRRPGQARGADTMGDVPVWAARLRHVIRGGAHLRDPPPLASLGRTGCDYRR